MERICRHNKMEEDKTDTTNREPNNSISIRPKLNTTKSDTESNTRNTKIVLRHSHSNTSK